MLRGDDVAELQRRLNALGFDAGREDGIFGRANARRADRVPTQRRTSRRRHLRRQRRSPRLARVGTLADGEVSAVREREALRRAPRSLVGRRVFVTATPGFIALGETVVAPAASTRRARSSSTRAASMTRHSLTAANDYDGRALPRDPIRGPPGMSLRVLRVGPFPLRSRVPHRDRAVKDELARGAQHRRRGRAVVPTRCCVKRGWPPSSASCSRTATSRPCVTSSPTPGPWAAPSSPASGPASRLPPLRHDA